MWTLEETNTMHVKSLERNIKYLQQLPNVGGHSLELVEDAQIRNSHPEGHQP